MYCTNWKMKVGSGNVGDGETLYLQAALLSLGISHFDLLRNFEDEYWPDIDRLRRLSGDDG